MSFESNTTKPRTEIRSMSNNLFSDITAPNQEQNQEENQQPISLTGMLHNKELLTCYKCKEVFDPEKQDNEHTLDSNNILMGIILNKTTPSSICLKCLSLKMMEVITEQFTKNSKDYTGMFFNYAQKFKS